MFEKVKAGLGDVFSVEGVGLLIGLIFVFTLFTLFLGVAPSDWLATKARQVTGKS